MLSDSARQGVSSPDEAAARAYCFGEGVRAPALATVRDFFYFYAATSHGEIVKESIANSVNAFAKWFFAGSVRLARAATNARKQVDFVL